jgi:hypothetical protein
MILISIPSNPDLLSTRFSTPDPDLSKAELPFLYTHL